MEMSDTEKVMQKPLNAHIAKNNRVILMEMNNAEKIIHNTRTNITVHQYLLND